MTAPLLSASALAAMRAVQNANMPSVCDLIGYSDVRASGGRDVRTRVLLATVPCRLVNTTASLPLRADQPTPDAAYLLVMPEGTDLTGAELATVRGTVDGVAWSRDLVLAGTPEPRSYSASTRVYANLAPASTGAPTTLVATVTVSDTP